MNINLRKIVFIALYTALFVILSLYGTINFQSLKITLQNFPMYIAGITLGTFSGAMVGFAGMFINQLIVYGFTATTLFWVLPQTIVGAICGYLCENKIVKCEVSQKFFVAIIILQLIITMLNTIVQTIDAFIYGYFNPIIVFGPVVIRTMVSILTGIVYYMLLPIVVSMIKKIH